MSVENAVPCPLLESCGACNRMHLSMDEQLHRKNAWVGEKLSHTVTAMFPSPSEIGYRARIRMRFGPRWLPRLPPQRNSPPCFGQHCPIAHPQINAMLPTLPERPSGSHTGVQDQWSTGTTRWAGRSNVATTSASRMAIQFRFGTTRDLGRVHERKTPPG